MGSNAPTTSVVKANCDVLEWYLMVTCRQRKRDGWTDRQTNRQIENISVFGACCHHRQSETNQTCLPCSAALKGAVTDMLSQLFSLSPPLHPTTTTTTKSSHRPYPNTMLCLLSAAPTTTTSPPLLSHSVNCDLLSSLLLRLLFTVKWNPSQSHSAVGLLFISLVFFFLCSISHSLFHSLSLSGWELI